MDSAKTIVNSSIHSLIGGHVARYACSFAHPTISAPIETDVENEAAVENIKSKKIDLI
jgi:hypothetical protein